MFLIYKIKKMSKQQFQIDSTMLATQGQRFTNFIIDYVSRIVVLIAFMFVYMFLMMFTGSEEMVDLEGMGFIEEYAIQLAVLLIYYNLMEIFTSRTIGKFVTKTIVGSVQ